MKIKTEIAIEEKKWKNHSEINKSLINKVTKNIINRFSNLKQIKNIEISILLTNDGHIKELNHRFLGEQKPTDVLSFPATEINYEYLLEFKPDLNYMYLGDIAFSYDYISKEVININKTFNEHFIHLLVHSILHLLGFDHSNSTEESVMQRLENLILKDFSIDPPYYIK